MKKLLLILVSIFICFESIAQAPDGFNYQAVVRDQEGNVKANEEISMTIMILQGSSDGETIYLENHNPTTNQQGLVNLKIGQGTSSDQLSDINWANGPYYMRVQVNGNTLGTSKLLSVPYAKYADQTGSLSSGTNKKGDMLYYDGSQWVRLQQPTNQKYFHYMRWDFDQQKPYWGKVTPKSPEVTDGPVTDITSGSAKCSGEVTDNGDAPILAAGIVWSTETPTSIVTDNVVEAEPQIGEFTVEITGLEEATRYYSKAFVANVKDTVLGGFESWETTSSTTIIPDNNNP